MEHFDIDMTLYERASIRMNALAATDTPTYSHVLFLTLGKHMFLTLGKHSSLSASANSAF